MPATITDRLDGLTTSVAVKAPCVAVATSNITLAGLQTIGGVALVDDDRVLVTAQTDDTENGIYTADSGDWTRALDFDGSRDAVQGTLVLVRNQFTEGAFYELTSDNPVTFGLSSITFRLRDAPNVTYDLTTLEVSEGVTPADYSIEPYDVLRYGALGDDSNNDALAAQIVADLGAHYTRFRNGLEFRLVPNSVSPYTFGNAPTVNVYGAVLLTASDHMIEGPGSKLHIVSRTGTPASSDLHFCYISNKNLTASTQRNIVFRGTSVDNENDADAANSNHRGYYMTGVNVVRLLHTRAFSSGNRRGSGGYFQNCDNVQIIGHLHQKNTQGFNFRYCRNMLIVGGIFDDFSECIDLDGTQDRAVIWGQCFQSTNRINQMVDCNGQVGLVLGGFTAYNLGQIANISHKFTTPDNFADYVNNVAAVVKTPSQRIIVTNFEARAIGTSASVCFVIGNDWADGGHAGYEGPHDVLIGTGMVEDTSYIMVWECERLTLRDLYLGAVVTAATFYAVNLTSRVNTGDQRSWSTLTGLIDGLVINGCERGGLRVQNAKTMAIRNVTIRNCNTSGSTDFAVQLSGLIERGAQITVDGLDIDGSGNVNINGNSASIAAWAGTTLYRRSQVVSNGGRWYRATSDSGTSAGAGGPTGTGSAIIDGTVTWEYLNEPFSIYWGPNNRLRAGSTIVFTGDAHKYTHGRLQTSQLGDIPATGTYSRPLYIARRKCYVVRALLMVAADVAADAVNFRTFVIRSLTNLAATTTAISSVSTAAGLTAYVAFDLGFTINEAGAYLQEGDAIYTDISATAGGKALTGAFIELDVLEC